MIMIKKRISIILAFVTSFMVILIMQLNEFSVLSAGILMGLLVICLQCQIIEICLSSYAENRKKTNLAVTVLMAISTSLIVILIPFIHILHEI